MHSYRLYNKTDFDKILNIFIKFQKGAKIKSMYGNLIQKTPMMVNSYSRYKLECLISESDAIYVGTVDDDIWGVVFFKDEILTLCFKDPDFVFNKVVKTLFLSAIDDYKQKTGKKVFALLGEREKMKKYINFMLKTFDISEKGVDNMGRTIIEFL
tara:strand:+ start:697 stop:1161 length:465 start_codon:yes stop_codon:yes gene_type:complete